MTNHVCTAFACISVLIYCEPAMSINAVAEDMRDVPPPLLSDEGAGKIERKVLGGRSAIPSSEDIDIIRAELYNSASLLPEVLQFDVPKKYYEDVLALFDTPSADRDPILSLPESGSLLIKSKDGRFRRLCWYSGAPGPLKFSLQGFRFVSGNARKPDGPTRDDAWALDKLIREAHGTSKEE